MKDVFKIGNKEFTNRLFTGTGKFASKKFIPLMLEASGSEMITVALRRVDFSAGDENILSYIPKNVVLLPNTSGARNSAEAVRIANIAREAGCGDFIKIEVINDSRYLMPDNMETLKATEILVKDGFTVLPYVMPDVSFIKRFEDAGAAAIMPLGSAIGSNRGIRTKEIISMLIELSRLPIIVDAGIGRPSQAAEAMEMGAAAVLVNTAISSAEDPVTAGKAFSLAVQAGRMAYLADMRGEITSGAVASSPLTGFLGERK